MSRLSRWLGIDDLAESMDILLEKVEAMEREMTVSQPTPINIVEAMIADDTPAGTTAENVSITPGDIVKGYERPH